MKEINLDQLFQELKQEATEVQISEIAGWVKNIPSPGFRFKIASSTIGISIILIGIYSFLSLNEKNSAIKKNNTTVLLSIERLAPMNASMAYENETSNGTIAQENNVTIDLQQPIEPLQEFSFNKLALKSIKSNQSTISKEKNTSKNWMSNLFEIPSKQAMVFDSVIPQQNSLYILDTVQNYRSNKKLGMDEKDCYMQILNDYVVISYLFRGKTVFRSGKIYETGTMSLDGKTVRVYAFICDNRYSPANFGQRIFFGVSEPVGNATELIFFGTNWEPFFTIHSHVASENERKKLMERSSTQKNL